MSEKCQVGAGRRSSAWRKVVGEGEGTGDGREEGQKGEEKYADKLLPAELDYDTVRHPSTEFLLLHEKVQNALSPLSLSLSSVMLTFFH